jgi:polysaccharide biosynthesis/export protein
MKTTISILFVCLTCVLVPAQQKEAGAVAAPVTPNAEERLRLAASTGSYPVTPGDVYRLTFQQAGVPATLEILVGSDYTIQLNVFGKVNATGMTFTQAKQTIEKAFVGAYPRSMPSLALASVGVFQVFLTGETSEARDVEAWGMSHLSDIVEGRLGRYSCLRNIRIVSSNGTEQVCDLFRYKRLGAANQNPFMKAGDTVVVSPSERTVEIGGEVRRPGTYQLLPSENLKEMIETFGGGLTTAAETSRVRFDRMSGERAQTWYLDLMSSVDTVTPLEDGDVITVPSKLAILPMIFFEGAVTAQAGAGTPGTPVVEPAGLFAPVNYNRIPYRFRQGETLKSALTVLKDSISPLANLSAAFLVRAGVTEPMPLDLEALISGASATADVPLFPLDRIVIPTAQFFVSVYGDVTRPGNYPYTPGKTYRHYADLSGFADLEEIPRNIVIIDGQGRRRGVEELVEPGSRVFLAAARVTVQGAVVNPGNFTYRRDFSALDYENLAGGYDPERSTNRKMTIFDSKGSPRMPTDRIQPGDRIYVEADSFVYNLGKGLPVFLSILGAVTSVVTIYALLR